MTDARLPRFALLERFADAHDRQEAGALRGLETSRNDGVRLAVKRPPLGVSDDHVAAADVAQHCAGDLARVSARAGPVRQVLRAEGDRAALQPALDGRQIDVRRAQQHRRRRAGGDAGAQCVDEAPALGERAIHFPVAGNQ